MPKPEHAPKGQMKPVNATRTLEDGTVENKIFATKTEWKARNKAEGWQADADEDDESDVPV